MSSGEKSLKSSNSCLYCGNNPAPHFLTWYFESLDLLLQPLRRAIFFNPVSRALRRFLKNHNFGWRLMRFLLSIGFVRKQPDIAKCKVRRAQVLWEEAERRGITFYGLKFLGKNLDLYMAEKSDGQKLFIDGLPRPRGYDGSVLDILDDKSRLKAALAAAGLPVPLGGAVTSVRAALKIFKQGQKPFIVKPRTGSRGRHTTTFIYTDEELRRAIKIAKQLCAWVVVEEQLFGPVYRATVIGGPSTALRASKLAGVLRGDPPQVTGDGRHNIEELIHIKNAAPHAGVKNIVADDGMGLFLQRQNLELTSVPKIGELVNLSEKIGVNYGGSSSEDFDVCHPDNKELFLRAAKVLGDPIIGFDFIIPDITKSYKDQRCGFLEANSLPFINLHHDPLLGKPRNAAALVWDMMGIK